jgi:hypothetical protein
LQKKRIFWGAFGVLLTVFAVVQFIPSPPLVIPAQLAADQRQAHRLLNFEGIVT